MANEVQARGPGTGRTMYYTMHNRTGSIWSTSGGTGGFVSFVSGDWTDYAISMTEQGVSNFYLGSIPAATPAGILSIDARQQLTGGALQTDPGVAAGDLQWNGTVTLPLSDLATSGQVGQFAPIRIAKGVAISGFNFFLRSSADHVTPFVSGQVSGQVSKNGGAFGPLQSGVFSEIGLGFYSVNLTSGDLYADTLAFVFSAINLSGGIADSLPLSIIPQRVSGSF